MASVAYVRAFYQDYQVRQEIIRLQEDARNFEAKKIQLLDVLKYVKSDEFVEERARMEFNMTKPGEQVLVLDASQPKQADRQGEDAVVRWNRISNILKWWRYFFGNRS